MQSSVLPDAHREETMAAHCNILGLHVGYERLSQVLWMAVLLFFSYILNAWGLWGVFQKKR